MRAIFAAIRAVLAALPIMIMELVRVGGRLVWSLVPKRAPEPSPVADLMSTAGAIEQRAQKAVAPANGLAADQILVRRFAIARALGYTPPDLAPLPAPVRGWLSELTPEELAVVQRAPAADLQRALGGGGLRGVRPILRDERAAAAQAAEFRAARARRRTVEDWMQDDESAPAWAA